MLQSLLRILNRYALNRYASIVILSLLLATRVDAQVSGQQAGASATTRPADSVAKEEDHAAANPSGKGDIGVTDTSHNGEPGVKPSATDEAKPATAQADTLPVEQLESELQKVRQEIQAAQKADTPQRAKELGISEEELHTRETLLQDLIGAIQKRLTSLKRLDEAKQTIVGLEKQLSDRGEVGLDLKHSVPRIPLGRPRIGQKGRATEFGRGPSCTRGS